MGSPAVSRPELRYVVLSNDEAALVRALHAPNAGVDVALGLGPAALPGLAGLTGRGLRVLVRPSLAVEHLELNMDVPALRDQRVRRALQAAIGQDGLHPRRVRHIGRAGGPATSLVSAHKRRVNWQPSLAPRPSWFSGHPDPLTLPTLLG